MSERLSQFSSYLNTKTLTRLRQVMNDHKILKIQVADLLDVSKSLVTKWFQHHKKCPDNYPELLRAILEIRSPSSIKKELDDKRSARRKHK